MKTEVDVSCVEQLDLTEGEVNAAMYVAFLMGKFAAALVAAPVPAEAM